MYTKKRDDFSFCIVKFPFICGNIPSAPAYEVSYHNSYVMPEFAETTQTFCIVLDFLQLRYWDRATRLKSSLQKFYGRLHELVDRYGVSISTMKTDFTCHSFGFGWKRGCHNYSFYLTNYIMT